MMSLLSRVLLALLVLAAAAGCTVKKNLHHPSCRLYLMAGPNALLDGAVLQALQRRGYKTEILSAQNAATTLQPYDLAAKYTVFQDNNRPCLATLEIQRIVTTSGPQSGQVTLLASEKSEKPACLESINQMAQAAPSCKQIEGVGR